MKDFYILVEGKADKKFFEDYYHHLFGKEAPSDSIRDTGESGETGGYTKIESEATLQLLRRNTDNDILNIVVFDADDNFKKRRQELLAVKDRCGVEFELFLLPNDSDNGELEDLLEGIISPQNKPVMDCWHHYERNLSDVHGAARDPLTIPAKKTKIYAYLEVLLGASKSQKKLIKDINRDYLNSNHWNLDSDMLNPLKTFLLRLLTEKER